MLERLPDLGQLRPVKEGKQELGNSKEHQLLNGHSGVAWGLQNHHLLLFLVHKSACIPFTDEEAGSEKGKQGPSIQKWPNCEWKASLSHSNAFILSSPPFYHSLVLLVGMCEQEDPDPDLSSHLLPHSGLRQAALRAAATHPEGAVKPQLSLLRAKDDSSCTGNSVTLIMCLFFPFPASCSHPPASFSSFFRPPLCLPSHLSSVRSAY
uniref:Uncharacterized protein n=1 Tax=Pipistrellus kuhlii TaxID=59472 RepID=A0A7J7SG37_PIPKU|nr:hypothetical protein mPipKuh1_009951 [Pipistrellus kuhlii]